MLTNFGQPFGGIAQYAYTVADLHESIDHYVRTLGMGPWFTRGPFTPPDGVYRGQPSTMTVSLARAFSGHAMIELIQQHDDGPSVYRERIESSGYGFHHWAIPVRDYEHAIAEYAGKGFVVVFSDVLPSGARIAYLDDGVLPGMLEVVELNAHQERVYTLMHLASVEWDGRDPIRADPA